MNFIQSIDQIGSNWHLINIEPSNLKQNISLFNHIFNFFHQFWMCPHINTYFAKLIPNNFIFDDIVNDIFIWNPRCSLLVLGKAYVLLLFCCSVLSNSLWPYELQHISLPCPPLFPGVCSKSGPLNQRCHPTISSSVVCFSSCRQSFPESGSFPVSQFFTSGGQSIGASASASVLPTNTQGWFPLGLTGLISLLY